MALWQVQFVLFPINLAEGRDEIPEKVFPAYVEGTDGSNPFSLPADYRTCFSELLPLGKSWSSEMEIWGHEESDDIQVWPDDTGILLIDVRIRIDIRKLDDALLSGLLALAQRWSCVLVETRYRKVCDMSLQQFRTFIAGHSHSRALRDPTAWLPFLAEEARKNDPRA